MSIEIPIATSIALCDQILREEVHGKVTLVGVFSTVVASQLPCSCAAVCVYTALTNGRGSMGLEVRCVNAGHGAVIASITKSEHFNDPTNIREVTFVLRGLTFTEEGNYSFELRGNGDLIAETQCRVILPHQAVEVS